MMYSVWNQGLGAYDYFEDSSRQEVLNTPAPTHIRSRTMGTAVQAAAWPLPVGAKKVGSGPQAIGRVASRRSAPGLGDVVDEPVLKAGLLLGAAYLGWKYLLKGRS